MSVHEEKRSFEKVIIRKADFSLFLDFESRGAGNQFHEILADTPAIISVVGAVFDTAHEESGLFVLRRLSRRGN